ncbi:methyl-accepting chemotaxis protein [Phormidium yuhuli AB48]|uniref:Methyl-accepting chemotaxis protein n=1 Tax=Phormidium yuhuli AB48 TaxID=2940671 RepID=A0ABY5ALB2_9CYAN|nr:methyl-accepting chemotaxis protein [Phormidium yuhuli]USR89997.1 methyl-accepting chemotaxis protein [Phormidium yuhuli AB48]
MFSLKQQRIRTWIIGGYAVPIVLSLLSFVMVWNNVRTLQQEAEQVEEFIENDRIVDRLELNAQVLSRTLRGYLLEPSAISVNTYNEARQNFYADVPLLRERLRGRPELEQLEDMVEAIDQLVETHRGIFLQVEAGDRDGAIESWSQLRGRAQAEEIQALFTDFSEREKSLVLESQVAQQESLEVLIVTTITFTVLTLGLSGLVGWWVISRITRQMNDAASSVASSSMEIAATMEQQERTASQQAASVNETTTTMDELGASARQVMTQAESATGSANQVLSQADNGTRAVEETLQTMYSLKDRVSAIAQQILRLSEQTNQIGNISNLVSDLANQTNMLALNAAVEAVRAGEHGKGFSVVASEIRKLADQSKKSAEKINTLVEDIQNAINTTVMVTDEGTKSVESGVQVSQNTSHAFAGVREGINQVVMSNQQITLTLKQQVNAVEQVIEAMTVLNVAAQETATGITQVKEGTQRLNQAAVSLKDLV